MANSVVPFNAGIDDPNISMLLHMTGTNGSAIFTDSGYGPLSVVNGGSVIISNAQSEFGTTSGLFPGNLNDGYLAPTPDTGLFVMGTQDFTFEVWAYLTGNPFFQTNFCTGFFDTRFDSNAPGILFALSNDFRLTAYSQLQIIGSNSALGMGLNAWHHLCWMRKSGVVYFFVDGVVDSSTPAFTKNLTSDTPTVGMSIERSAANPRTQGYLNDMRLSRIAQYPITGFTPSTSPLPNGNNPSLLPASPAAGQLALSSSAIYACTSATGPVWKRVGVNPT